MGIYVEQFNFDTFYKTPRRISIKVTDQIESLQKSATIEFNCIKAQQSIYNKRYLNFVSVMCDLQVNPQVMMRFDVR